MSDSHLRVIREGNLEEFKKLELTLSRSEIRKLLEVTYPETNVKEMTEYLISTARFNYVSDTQMELIKEVGDDEEFMMKVTFLTSTECSAPNHFLESHRDIEEIFRTGNKKNSQEHRWINIILISRSKDLESIVHLIRSQNEILEAIWKIVERESTIDMSLLSQFTMRLSTESKARLVKGLFLEYNFQSITREHVSCNRIYQILCTLIKWNTVDLEFDMTGLMWFSSFTHRDEYTKNCFTIVDRYLKEKSLRLEDRPSEKVKEIADLTIRNYINISAPDISLLEKYAHFIGEGVAMHMMMYKSFREIGPRLGEKLSEFLTGSEKFLLASALYNIQGETSATRDLMSFSPRIVFGYDMVTIDGRTFVPCKNLCTPLVPSSPVFEVMSKFEGKTAVCSKCHSEKDVLYRRGDKSLCKTCKPLLCNLAKCLVCQEKANVILPCAHVVCSECYMCCEAMCPKCNVPFGKLRAWDVNDLVPTLMTPS